ncbi:hypothetical protein NDU88_010686 [Pleurodeles waltl]|uniref:Uncharacterized protein n=1 Tax=Pleurodeles waltl TaxID=8319 RepID=A0AAV7PVL5_PLEWA|nr:hypothetical protein NDU88_010686 [Pleurodeles waltl]
MVQPIDSTEFNPSTNPTTTKKPVNTSNKLVGHHKKEGYKMTDFLLTKPADKSIPADHGSQPVLLDMDAATATTSVVTERTLQDRESFRSSTPSTPNIITMAEVHTGNQQVSSTLNLSNWNNWSLNSPLQSPQVPQLRLLEQSPQGRCISNCTMTHDPPAIDLSDTCATVSSTEPVACEGSTNAAQPSNTNTNTNTTQGEEYSENPTAILKQSITSSSSSLEEMEAYPPPIHGAPVP